MDQVLGLGIPGPALFLPPPGNGVDGELGGVMILAHRHPAALVGDVGDSIGAGFPDAQMDAGVALDVGRMTGRMPRTARVLEVAHEVGRRWPRRGSHSSSPRGCAFRRSVLTEPA